jgi:hypothetical protein
MTQEERIAFQECGHAAMHEAGHAFLNWWFGHKIDHIAIGPNDGDSYCQLAQSWEISERGEHLRRSVRFNRLIATCGGYVAGGAAHDEWKESKDYHRAFERALQLSGGDEQAAASLVEWAHLLAQVMIENHLGKVQKLAAAVQEKQRFTGNGRFSGAEIRQVLGGNGA